MYCEWSKFGLLLPNKLRSVFLTTRLLLRILGFSWSTGATDSPLDFVGISRNCHSGRKLFFPDSPTLGPSAVGQRVARTSVKDGGFNCVSEHYKGFQQLCGRTYLKIGSDVWCWKEFSVSEPTRTVHGFFLCSFLPCYLHHRNTLIGFLMGSSQ